MIGISWLEAGHKMLAPQLIAAPKALGAEDVIGGVVSRQGYQFFLDAARAVLDLMEGRRLRSQ